MKIKVISLEGPQPPDRTPDTNRTEIGNNWTLSGFYFRHFVLISRCSENASSAGTRMER